MRKSRLKGVLFRVLTLTVMLVMLGSACLPTAAQAIIVPSENPSEDPYATLAYSDGVFDIRLNADALYEMLLDGSVTREELTRFIPEEVLELFVNGTPTLDQMKSVLAKYISQEDLEAMVADLPLDLVKELFDIELVTGLFSIEELMGLIDLETILADIDPDQLMALLEGEEGAEVTPLDLLLENETLWNNVITDEFVEDLLGDESFLKLVDDPEVQKNLRALLEDPDKVNYKALLENEIFIQRVLQNEKVLPDLVAALVGVKNAEGNSIIFDLFTDELLDRLLNDGLLMINEKTIAALIEIGAVKLDTETLSVLDFGKLLSDSGKLQDVLDVLFEGTEGQDRVAELAKALYGDATFLEKLQTLNLALLTEWGIVRLDGVDAQKILKEIRLDPSDVLDYMPGEPTLEEFARAVLNLSGDAAVINLANFVKEFSSSGLIHIENVDLKDELLAKLTNEQKISLGEKYAEIYNIKFEDYLNKSALAQALMAVMTDGDKLALAEKYHIDLEDSQYVERDDLAQALLSVMTLDDKLELARKYGIDPEDPTYFNRDALVNDLLAAMSLDEKLELAETYGIDLDDPTYFNRDGLANDLLAVMSFQDKLDLAKAYGMELDGYFAQDDLVQVLMLQMADEDKFALAEQYGIDPQDYFDSESMTVDTAALIRDLMQVMPFDDKLNVVKEYGLNPEDYFDLESVTDELLTLVTVGDVKDLAEQYGIEVDTYFNLSTLTDVLFDRVTMTDVKDLAEQYGIEVDTYFNLSALSDVLFDRVTMTDVKDLAEQYEIDLQSFVNVQAVTDALLGVVTAEDAQEYAEKYGIDPEDYFDRDSYMNAVLAKMSNDDKQSEMMALIQSGTVSINDLEAWGAFAWEDITVDLLMNASDVSVNKTNLFNYITTQIDAVYGLSNWIQDLCQRGKISFDQLKAWGVISIDTAGMEKLMAYRDDNGNPIVTTSDLLKQECVKEWLSDTDLMVDMFKAQIITTSDLKTWGLLDLNKVFSTYNTPEKLEAAGIMSQQNLNKVMLEYIRLEDIQAVLLGNSTAFSAAVDVLIAHLSDIWDDFVACVDFATVFPDMQAVANAITYEKIIELVGLPTLIEAAGGYKTLFSFYSNEELTAIFEAIGTDKLQTFATEAGLIDKLDIKALLTDFLELAKSKPERYAALKEELIFRVANLFLDQTRDISINGHTVFVTSWSYAYDKYGADYVEKNVATVGAFDMNRVLAVLISSLPDINDFLEMGDNDELFSLLLNWDLKPDENGAPRNYSLGVRVGFIGSLDKLQGLLEQYRDRFTMDASYEFSFDKNNEFEGSALKLDMYSGLPAAVGATYETLLQTEDDELHEFLVDLPNKTLTEVVDFLSGLSDEKLEALAPKIAALSGTLRTKLTAAFQAAGSVPDGLTQKVDAILEKLTTADGLRSLRDRIVSLLVGQLGVIGDNTVDSFYKADRGVFEIRYEREVSLLNKITGFVELPPEISALFVDNLNLTLRVNLSLKFANIHRVQVIRAADIVEQEPVAQTYSLRRLRTPVVDTGVNTTVLYAPAGADPAIFRMGTLYDIDHNVLTAMPSEDAVVLDDGVRTMVFDYRYEGSTDGTVATPLTYIKGYEESSIYELPNPADGVTLKNGYHYVWTVNGEEIDDIAELHEKMESNPGRLTVKLLQKNPVMTFVGSFERPDGSTPSQMTLTTVEYAPGESTFDQIFAQIKNSLDATNRSHNYQAMIADGSLKAAVEQIVSDAASNEGPYDSSVTVNFELNRYKITLTHKENGVTKNTYEYWYKHGTTTLLDSQTIATLPRGYAWPEIAFGENADLSYDSYAIEYKVIVGGVAYTVTVETPMLENKTAWESFLAATGAPANPAAKPDFATNGWTLNGKLPTDADFGFMLPSNANLTLPSNPDTPLFELVASYTRTHAWIVFYNQSGTAITEAYRYALGDTFDLSGATYGLTAPYGYHIDGFFDKTTGAAWEPNLSGAPESGTYHITVKFTINERDKITIYGNFEQPNSSELRVEQIYSAEYEFNNPNASYDDLIEAILLTADAKKQSSHHYDREALKQQLQEFFEIAAGSVDAYVLRIGVDFDLNVYSLTLTHKEKGVTKATYTYQYKHGTSTLLDSQTIAALPLGYAWPEIAFDENKNLSYDSYAIEYKVFFDANGQRNTVTFTVENYENLRIADPAAPSEHFEFVKWTPDWSPQNLVTKDANGITAIHDGLVYTAEYRRIAGRLQFVDENDTPIGSYRYMLGQSFDATGNAYKNSMQIPYGYHIDKFVDADGNVWAPDLTTAPEPSGTYVVKVLFAPNTITIVVGGSFEQPDETRREESIFSTTFTFDQTDFDTLWAELLAELDQKKGVSHNYLAMLGDDTDSALKDALLALIEAGSTPDGDSERALTVVYDLNIYTITLTAKEKGVTISTYTFKYKHGTTTLRYADSLAPAALPTLSRGYAWPEIAYGENTDLSHDSYAIVYRVTFRLSTAQVFRMTRQTENVLTFTYTFDDYDPMTGMLILKEQADATQAYEVPFDPDTGKITLTDELKARLTESLPKRGYTVTWPDEVEMSDGEVAGTFFPSETEAITYYATFKDGNTVIEIVEFTVEDYGDEPEILPIRGYKDLAWAPYSWLPADPNEEPSSFEVQLQKTAIEYKVVVGGAFYTVTVETPMLAGKTAWESFLAATSAPARPAFVTDFEYYGWALDGKLPWDDGFGFKLPSDTSLTLPADPNTPLFVLEASYTRTHGWLYFYNEQGTLIGSYRYMLGQIFDATGEAYRGYIYIPNGHHIDRFVDADGNVWAPDLSTAPENGMYLVWVVPAPNRYVVTFYDLNGNLQASGAYLYGSASLVDSAPEAPSLLGYYVDWFYDANRNTVLDADERITDWGFLSELEGDIAVYAKAYELVTYTITFRLSNQDADVIRFTYTIEDYDPATGKLSLRAGSTVYPLDFNPETGELTLSDTIKTRLSEALPKRGYTVTWPNSLTLTAGQMASVQIAPSAVTPITYWATFMDGDTVIGDPIPFDVTTQQITPPDLPNYPGYTVAWDTYTLPAFTTQVPSNITVSLIKTPITYKATFMDGDTAQYVIEFTVEDVDSFVAPPVPEREGYTGAWESFTLSASDMTIKVVWTPVEGEDTPTPDGGDTPGADDSADFGWILWLIIGILIVAIIALLVIFLVLKNKNDDDDDDDNDPTPIVIVPEPEAEPEVEPVVEPEPVVKAYEPVAIKATYLSATSRAVINLCDLDTRFAEGDVVTLALLQEMKLVSKKEKRLKVLGAGTITKALTVEADYFSGAAAEKIRAAGGTPVYKQ